MKEVTSPVIISRCLWLQCRELVAKLADCSASCDWTCVTAKGSHRFQTPNIMSAPYLSSLATWNNAGHMLLLLLLVPRPVIYKWTQLIKVLSDCLPYYSSFICNKRYVKHRLYCLNKRPWTLRQYQRKTRGKTLKLYIFRSTLFCFNSYSAPIIISLLWKFY